MTVPRSTADSSNPWFPDLPVGWDLASIRSLARSGTKTFVDGDWVERPFITDSGIRLLQTGNVGVGVFKEQGFRYIAESSFDVLNCTEVDPGDVLICRLADPVGRACAAPDLGVRLITSVDVAILKASTDFDSRFIVYGLSSHPYLEWAQALCRGGTRSRISRSQLGTLLIPVPPLPTQRAIADFLDRKTAAIDALIEKKERLLELLAEKRAALIHRAVTKGLDPDVPMKDSGVPWIGEIPAHWAFAPIYSRYTVQLGKMLDAARQTGEHAAPYLRNANIQWDRVDIEDLKTMDFGPSDRLKYSLEPGDILMCEGGANANVVGKSAVWDGQVADCFYQKALHRIRPSAPGEHSRFMLFAFWAAASAGAFVADSNANIFHLTAEKLRVMRFPFPRGNEQERVVARLDADLERLLSLAEKVSLQLGRLREYRQALITAAVTGQLYIPGAA